MSEDLSELLDRYSILVGAPGFEPGNPLACKASALPLSYAPVLVAVGLGKESLSAYRFTVAGRYASAAHHGTEQVLAAPFRVKSLDYVANCAITRVGTG